MSTITKPEETKNYIRIPNPKHTESGCQNIRTIPISESKGISGLYCIDHKKIKTYLFLKAKGWTMQTAREWVASHSKGVSMEDIKTEEQLLNELKEKIKKAIFTKAFKEKDEKGDNVFVVSDDVEDREGEVISTEGWKLENYKDYPVLLWSHNPNEPLIGHGTNLRYRTINGKKKLTFQPKFHRKSELSRLVGDLVDEDWIRGVSVGFRPLEKEGNVYTKQELLEISFVNVPANPNALSLATAKGYKDETIGKVMDIEKAKAMKDKIEQSKKVAEMAKKVLEKKEKEAQEIEENPDKEIEKKEEKPKEETEKVKIKPEKIEEKPQNEEPKIEPKEEPKSTEITEVKQALTEIRKILEVAIPENNKKVADKLKKFKLEIEGLTPDKSYDERLTNIEDNIVDLAEGLKILSGNQDKSPQKSGDGSSDTGEKKSVRIARKALNIITEVLNKELK